ncbi:hypothetical protein ACE3YI_000794 [Salmonella enterica]
MLITVELLMSDNLRRSLLTIGELDISLQPGLQTVIECYTERFATIPPVCGTVTTRDSTG